MSSEKNRVEANRWFRTATDDLDTAIILKKNSKFAHSCFHAQQSAEKAMKAVWQQLDADPWGHSIKKLIDDLESVDFGIFELFQKLSIVGGILDRFYIPTRYPNGLPDITPDVAFTEEDAITCIDYAGKIIEAVKKYLNIS
jgi:HEPN domain-containing protein